MERPDSNEALIDGALRMLREHLGLDIAFVAQLTDGLGIFRYVDSGDQAVIEVGDAVPAEESYCHYVARGELPQFLPDPHDDPIATRLAITAELPIGTHFSVPLVFSDGTIYGTFCGFSHRILDHLDERDLEVVGLLARLVAGHVEQAELERRRRDRHRQRLLTLEPGRDLTVVVQPIMTLDTRQTVGYEALARFPTLGQGPAEVFAGAVRVGAGREVELAATRHALTLLDDLPDPAYLAINLAPDTLTDGRLLELIRSAQPERIVLEITEHAAVTDYPELLGAVRSLSAAGSRLAIDDVGTGFSGLDHILRLDPDILKLDGVLVHDIDTLPAKQAMVAALIAFAAKVGTTVIAEQVETVAEADTLTTLGVTHAQGYLFARPAPARELFALALQPALPA